MSSKIDGVPRELLERLQSQTELSNDWDEVQALLAAPVVERQEPDYQLPAHARGDKWYGFGYCDFSSGEDKSRLIDYLKDLLDDVPEEPLYTAPPELAELQATIAEEKKWRESAEGGWREANKVIAMQREKLDAQEAEIERLKGGQGDPGAWIIQRGSIIEGMTGQRSVQLDRPSNECIRAHDVEPLFTSQPAPVAVLHFVCDRIPDQNGCTFIECENSEGSSINAGEWVVRPDGLAQLVVLRPPLKLPEYKRPPPGCVITQEMAAHNACLDKVKELNQ